MRAVGHERRVVRQHFLHTRERERKFLKVRGEMSREREGKYFESERRNVGSPAFSVKLVPTLCRVLYGRMTRKAGIRLSPE